MEYKPYTLGLAEATDIIYDTLMQNTNNPQTHNLEIELQEVDIKTGYIYFDVSTQKGIKRVHLQVSVEDKDN